MQMGKRDVEVYAQLVLRSVHVDSTSVFTFKESPGLREDDPAEHNQPQDAHETARLRRLLQVFRYFAVEVEHLFVRLGSVK